MPGLPPVVRSSSSFSLVLQESELLEVIREQYELPAEATLSLSLVNHRVEVTWVEPLPDRPTPPAPDPPGPPV